MKAASKAEGLIRNQLRPFFNKKSRGAFSKNIQTVRSLLKLDQLSEQLALCESRPAFPFPGLGNTFPQDTQQIPHLGFSQLTTLPPSRERALLIGRINFHENKLVAAIES